MKNINSQILLTTFGLIFSSANVFATECTPAPDCASLGYNKTVTDCGGIAVKCPTDVSKAYCLSQNNENNNISAGDILYGDGTVANGLMFDKKPIGIVFDAEKRLAIALYHVDQDGNIGKDVRMNWSSSSCDTSNLENCEDKNTLFTTCGLDGRKNTDAILASSCNGTTYAADAVNAYQPSNCTADFCKKGKWFLPSIKDLDTIYSFLSKINNSIALVVASGAHPIKENFYWSSTEYNSYGIDVWAYDQHSGVPSNNGKYRYTFYVRPAIAF